ncbi:MAG: sensor histidine kinase, partial [Coprobacillus sp.]
MREKLSKLNFLKKLSLVQQLIVVLSFVGLLLVTVLMPLVDYNLRSIIDDQMYETLSNSQELVIGDSYIPNNKHSKPTFHIIYDSPSNTFYKSNVNSQQLINSLYIYLFGEDFTKIINNKNAQVGTNIENKGQ